MRVSTLFLSTSLLAIFGLSACATGGDDNQRSERQRPADCVQQDFNAINSSVQTCVQNFGPRTLPEEMQMRQPHMVTVIDTPRGRYGNPLTWSVEVLRDGEPVLQREFGEDAAVEEGEERTRIRATVPLDDDEQLEPGVYEFRYQLEEEGEVGTTTIEVAPVPGAEEEQVEPPQEEP